MVKRWLSGLLVVCMVLNLVPAINLPVYGASQGYLVVTNTDSNSVVFFDAMADGNIAPVRTIAGGNTHFARPLGVEIYDGELYVLNHEAHAIEVFSPSDGDNVAPKRRIIGGMNFPSGFAFDNAEIYVTNYSGPITVYSTNDNGNVSPKRTIDNRSNAMSIVVVGDELFVTTYADAAVFVHDKNTGDLKRTLTGPETGLSGQLYGLAVSGGELFISDYQNKAIKVFALNASGNTAPLRVISGPQTQLLNNRELCIANGELLVMNQDGSSSAVTAYGVGDSGDVAPKRVIKGPNTTFAGTLGPQDLTMVAATLPDTLFTVTFDVQGGSAISTLTIPAGGSLNIAPLTTRDGYSFNGWFGAATGGTPIAFPYTPTASGTLYAQWTKTLTEADKLAADLDALTWETIKGTNTSADGVTAHLSLPTTGAVQGSTIAWSSTDAASISPDGMVFRPPYAQGDALVTLTATIVRDGATPVTKEFVVTVLKQPAETVLQSAVTNEDGTKLILTFAQEMTDPTGKHGQFCVSIDTLSIVPTTAALVSGDANQIELTLASPITSAQTVKVSYTAGDLIAVDGSPLMSFADRAVVNTLLPLTLTVTFDAQGGSAVSTLSLSVGSSIDSAPVTNRDGYGFNGWFDPAVGGTAIAFPYAPTGSVTLYAQWTKLLTEADKLSADRDTLTWEMIKGTNTSADGVTANLSLPAAGSVHGSTVIWISSNAAVISPDGAITRPSSSQGDASVTLTATIIRDGTLPGTKEFNLTVLKKPAETNSFLASLLVSGVNLSPAFDSAVTSYSASVSYETSTVAVTPVAVSSLSTLQIDGSPLVGESRSIDLFTGSNTIAVTVMAEDGITHTNYTVTITRASDSGNNRVTIVPDLSAYWHVDQVHSYSNLRITLNSGLTGDVILRLLDAQRQIVAISDLAKLTGNSDFYPYLHSSPGLSPGEYTADLVCTSGETTEIVTDFWFDGRKPQLTVTDDTVILDMEQWTVNDRPSIPGDDEIYVKVTAFGVRDPSELQLKLWSKDGSGTDQLVAQSTTGAWFGRSDIGASQILYRLQTESGCLLEKDVIYNLTAARVDDQPVITTQHSLAVTFNQPIVYQATVVDGAVGRVQLHLLNVPSGECELQLVALDSDWNELFSLSQTADYDGSGFLDVQLLDGGLPVYLSGNYMLSLKQNGVEVWSRSPFLPVFYDYEMFGERYLSAALLSAAPLALPAGPTVDFSARVANVVADPITVELVEVDQRGRVLRSVSPEPVALAALPAYDPNGYVFANLLTVSGQVPVTPFEQGKDYRWRINCQSTVGEARQLISATPLQLSAGPGVGQIMIEGALAGMQHHGEGKSPSFGPPTMVHYIGCDTTDLFVLLLDASGFSDLGQVAIDLLGPNEVVVGRLDREWLSEASPGLLRGRVAVSTTLSAGSYQVVVSYAGLEVARAPVTVLDQPMVGESSLNTYGSLRALPAGQSFAITLTHPFNLDPSQLQVRLWPASGGAQIVVQVSSARSGNSLTLHCQASQSLAGVYHAAVLYDGQPLMLYSPWGSEPLAPVAVNFLASAHVAAAIGEDESYHVIGMGFSPAKNYQAMLYRPDNPTEQVGPIALTVANSDCLVLAANQLSASTKGLWTVRVLEDGRSLPVSQELHIILQPSEQPVIQPVVTLNNGATFTLSGEVQVRVSSGTFGEMRYATSSAELSGAAYGPVRNAFTHTLSEGFGKKTLYLQFRDAAKRETTVIALSIDYLPSVMAEPVGYGVSTSTISSGMPLTIWAKSSVPVQATCEFLDADGNLIPELTLTLARTSLEQGIGTYSRSLHANSAFEAVRSVQLTLEDLVTKAKWSKTLPMIYEPTIFLGQIQTEYDQAYFFAAYVRQGSVLHFRVNGTPGMNGQAGLTYRKVGAEATNTTVATDLVESSPGVYTATATLSADAAFVSHVTYRLSSPSTEQTAERQEPINRLVVAAAQFTGLPNSTGAFDNAVLSIERTSGWGNYQQTVTGSAPLTFAALEPGSYRYALRDGQRTYATGRFELAAGATAEVSLALTPLPASLRVVAPLNAKGTVSYLITDASANSWRWFDTLGEPLPGLVVGDRVSYEIYLLDPSNQQYYQPKSNSITISQPNESATLELQAITKVTMSGRVIDQAFAKYGKTMPVAGAVVYLSQSFPNGNTMIYNNQSATTDQEGRFSLSVYPGRSGELHVSKDNYDNLWQEVTTQAASFSLDDDLELQYVATGYISMELEVAAPELLDQEHVYLLSQAPAWIISVTGPNGQPVLGWYHPQTRKYHFGGGHGLQPGDQVTVRLQTDSAQGLKLNQTELTTELDPHCSAHVIAQAVSPGEIQLAAESAADTPIQMLLFRQGNRIKQYSGTSLFSTREEKLAPGDYTVVLFSGDNLVRLNRLTTLNALQPLGLLEGLNYVQRTVTVEQGRISDLGTITVPIVTNEELGYLADQGTSLSLTAGALVEPGKARGAVTVRYALPERLVALGYEIANVNIQLSTGAVVDRQFYLNGQRYWAGYSNHITTPINMEDKAKGTIYFQLELEGESQLQLTAWAMVQTPNRQSVSDTIFDGQLNLPVLTLTAPEEVALGATDAVQLQGVAYSGQKVSLYDGGVLIGETVADARGRWQTTVNFPNASFLGAHQITAAMTVNDQTIEATTITRVARSLITEARVWQEGRFVMNFGMSDDVIRQTVAINPSVPVMARFKLTNADPADVEYAGLANDYHGNVTIYRAKYQTSGDHAGFWLVDDAYLYQPGALSIVYSLKVQSDPLAEARAMTELTNTRMIDITELSDQPQVDPNTLPSFMREAYQGATEPSDLLVEGSYHDGSDGGPISSQLDLGGGRLIQFSGTQQTLADGALDKTGLIRIETEQGHYWTGAPSVTIDEVAGTVRVVKRVYFSQALWDALNPPAPQGRSIARSVRVQTMSTQETLQAVEYTSTATGLAGDLYELKKGADSLGRVGTGLNVLGGVSLAGNALLGSMGLDPAELRASANLITEDELLPERDRILRDITEYQSATRKSHYINTLIGGVSYGSSFFGPLGKGLSYVTNAGSMAYSSAIGSEYDTWGNAILSMIRSALAKQERIRLLAKKKKLNDPNWKIDPSGYVFEATEADRVPGITATVLVKDGDSFRAWSEAEDWGEISPQQTDSLGKYGWDVPEGEWKVRFAGRDYQTYETKSMQVPPLHDQVNIGLLATAAPQVTALTLYPDAVEATFDRYMLPRSLEGNITITDADGRLIPAKEILPLDPVANTGYTGAGPYSEIVIAAEQFAKSFRVIPDTVIGGFAQVLDDGTTPATYTVRLHKSVASYASVPMTGDYSATVAVSERVSIPLTVRARAQSKVYGEADPELTYEIVSGALSQGDALSGQLQRAPGESVGRYQIQQGTLSGDGKYSITYEPAELTISKRPLTVTADA